MKQKITYQYILISALAVVFTFLFHELTHFITGEILGYNMKMTLNSASPVSGNYINSLHENIVSISGPVFTVIQAIAFYLIIKKTKNYLLYPFLFAPFLMRIMAMVVSIYNPNDEARVSEWLGIKLWTLPILVVLLLFLLIYKSSKQQGYTFKFNAINYLLATVCISAVVLLNQNYT